MTFSKNQKISLLIVFVLLVSVFVFRNINTIRRVLNSQAQNSVELKAFPEAEGFGKDAKGGRGGKVMEVTNLNDSGPGSLRDCAESSGPRTCVFRVSGTIETQDMITIKNPFITIAGQSAPGDGITLKAAPSYGKGSLGIRTHDVIVRYIRVRAGPSNSSTSQRRGITVEASSETNTPYNIILDHVSISWATDDNLTLIDGVRDFTIQWSILSEALSQSTHSEGEHSKGLAVSGKMYNSNEKTGNVSIHHNLLAHNSDRNIRHAAWGTVDFVNNVIYNWGISAFEANDGQTKVPANIVGNYFKSGNDSDAYEVVVDADEGNGGGALYVHGNIGPNRSNDSLPQENIVKSDHRSYIVSTRFSAPQVTTTTALTAYNEVLAKAGSRIPRMDSVDQRIIESVKNRTGGIIDHPSEVGGWPNLAQVSEDTDADNDGMDDPWEVTYFGNTSRGSASNSSSDFDNDGYTDLEEFLNGTNPKVSDTGNVLPTPTGTQPVTSTPRPTSISTPTKNPLPTQKLSVTPTTRVTVSPTKTQVTTTPVKTSPSPGTCTKRSSGDANCDNVIDYIDFVCWRGELIGQKPINCVTADFNSSGGKPNSVDFTIWRNALLSLL